MGKETEKGYFTKTHKWALEYYGVDPLQVPYEPQMNNNSCGAASLKMLYSYWGKDVSQKEIWDQVKSKRPSGKGYYATTYSLARHARKIGFDTFTGKITYTGEKYVDQNLTSTFLQHIVNEYKIPPIICWRRPESDSGHFSVVTGANTIKVEVLDPIPDGGVLYGYDYVSNFWNKRKYSPWEQKDPSVSGVVGGLFVAIFPKGHVKEFKAPSVTRVFKNL